MAIDVITQLGGCFGYDYEPDGDEELRRQLEFLSVVGTNITRDAIEQFKQSTPKCSVY